MKTEAEVNNGEFTEKEIHVAVCQYINTNILLGAHRFIRILQTSPENKDLVKTMLDFYKDDNRETIEKLDSCWVITEELADMLNGTYFHDYGIGEWVERMGQVDGDGRGYQVWFSRIAGLAHLYSNTYIRRLAIRELRLQNK
jgi:hypothetical protein